MRAREDPRRLFTQEVVDRGEDVLALEQPLRARIDEAAHERPVLVERRPAVGPVLLERERQVHARVEIPVEDPNAPRQKRRSVS